MEPVGQWPEIASDVIASRIKVVSHRDATVLFISIASSAQVEITVPHNVLEWFIVVRDADGVEVLSDWMDHYHGTRADLEREMREEICNLTEELLGSATRLRKTARGSIVEAEHDGVWAQALPFVAEFD